MKISEIDEALYKDIENRLEALKKEREYTQLLLDVRKLLHELVRIENLPDCNTCKRQGCEYKPKLGEFVRFNCPLHKASAV